MILERKGMRKIKIVPDQVYNLSNQFRSNVNAITKMIAIIDSDLKNLDWHSNQRQQFFLSWEHQKSELVKSTNTLDNLSYQIHRKAELFEQADRESLTGLERIKPVSSIDIP